MSPKNIFIKDYVNCITIKINKQLCFFSQYNSLFYGGIYYKKIDGI